MKDIAALYEKYPVLFRAHPECWSDCPDGWDDIVDELCRTLEKLIVAAGSPAVHVHQIKEKFGTLRFYHSGAPKDLYEDMEKVIREAEAYTTKVCCRCGEPAERSGGRFSVLCDNLDCNAGWG
jgi:hypothetical protein